MTILTHGSDMSLAPTLQPLLPAAGGTVRGVVAKLSDLGTRGLQLDASVSGIRPRDLDQRARKDMLALLMRNNLQLSGIDLFIPRKHWLDPQQLDRATTATLAAIELAADLGRVPLSIALPVEKIDAGIRAALVESVQRHGAPLAIYAEDQMEALLAWIDQVDLPLLGVGLDAASILSQGKIPSEVLAQLGKRKCITRVNDLIAGSGASGDASVRCPLGQGELDLLTYRISLDLAPGRIGPVILDLRGLADPWSALATAQHVWNKSAFEL